MDEADRLKAAREKGAGPQAPFCATGSHRIILDAEFLHPNAHLRMAQARFNAVGKRFDAPC